MAFRIECTDTNYHGPKSIADGEFLAEASLFIDKLPWGTNLTNFNIRALRGRIGAGRNVIDVRIQAIQGGGLQVTALQAQSTPGTGSFAIPEAFYRASEYDKSQSGLPVVISIQTTDYRCTIYPPTSAIKSSQDRPWETKPWAW